MLTDLYKANVLSYCIIQVSSHKCLDFIEDYHKIASVKHQDQIFRILSENTGSTRKDQSTSDTSINMVNIITQQQQQ